MQEDRSGNQRHDDGRQSPPEYLSASEHPDSRVSPAEAGASSPSTDDQAAFGDVAAGGPDDGDTISFGGTGEPDARPDSGGTGYTAWSGGTGAPAGASADAPTAGTRDAMAQDQWGTNGADAYGQFPVGSYQSAREQAPPGGFGSAGSQAQPHYGSAGAGGYGGPSGPDDTTGGYGGTAGGHGGGAGDYGGYGTWGGPPGGYGRPPRRRRHGRFLALGAVAVLAAGIGAGAAVALNNNASPTGVSAQDVPNPHSNAAGSSATGVNQQAVAHKVDPGVVDITSTLKYNSAIAEGTGMVINSDGLVLTNNHVIDGATKITATSVTSGKKYTVKVVGYDATDDVALLRLQGASGLKTVKVGNSSQVSLGTPVLAMGNAEGQGGQPTVAAGVIDATNRTITASDQGNTALSETLHGMLQTNAQIEPGDSGGPLANAAGQVIGMDTAASSSNQGTTVYGYAIPIDRALSIAHKIASGHASSSVHIGLPGFIGVTVTDLNHAAACLSSAGSGGGSGPGGGVGGLGSGSGYGYTPPTGSGAVVCQVLSGTPAASSGLSAGDVITAVNGTTVSNANSLTKIMAKYPPGKTVSISYVKTGGGHATASVKLTAGPPK